MDRISRQNINEEIEYLKNYNQLNLDLYNSPHPTSVYTVSSSPRGTFSRVDHVTT